MEFTIYALFDPREPEAVRYIGFSSDPERRLNAHISEARKAEGTYKLNWIRSLLAENIMPGWRPLFVFQGTKEDAGRHEIRLIAEYRAAGCALTNGTEGGDGSTTWSSETRANRSELSSKYWANEETREAQRQKMLDWHASNPEHKQLIAETNKRIQTGRKRTAETKAKMRAAKLGKPGTPRTEEWKAKLADSNLGKTHNMTPEGKARHAAAVSEYWRKRREASI